MKASKPDKQVVMEALKEAGIFQGANTMVVEKDRDTYLEMGKVFMEFLEDESMERWNLVLEGSRYSNIKNTILSSNRVEEGAVYYKSVEWSDDFITMGVINGFEERDIRMVTLEMEELFIVLDFSVMSPTTDDLFRRAMEGVLLRSN